MPQKFSIPIEDVVELLGLERKPTARKGAASFDVRCPFCNSAYKMNINTEKNTYHCWRCGGDQKNTGALDLFGRVARGTPLVPGKDGNGKQLYLDLLDALKLRDPNFVHKKVSEMPRVIEIKPASDTRLHAAYSALLSLPQMKLSKQHSANLQNRGLSAMAILQNGYATAPDIDSFLKEHRRSKLAIDKIRMMQNEIKEATKEHPQLQKATQPELAVGLLIADDISRRGISMKNVPGFYRIGQEWFFRYEPGMLIPTRNMEGQIVSMQVRLDKKRKGSSLRYMTVSSKGYPNGPTVNISRVHFPLGNCSKDDLSNADVLITEGPLKADVASFFSNWTQKNTYFIALQGVNNTREIPSIVQELKKAGVSKIYNALDMDKISNPYVAKAGVALRKMLHKEGARFPVLLWDMEYLPAKKQQMQEYCSKNGIQWQRASSDESEVATMSKKIASSGKNAPKELFSWRDNTKGIDDYWRSFVCGELTETKK